MTLAMLVALVAGAIATLVGMLLVLPVLVNFLPSPWNDDIARYLPGEARFAALCVYSAVVLVVGAVRLD